MGFTARLATAFGLIGEPGILVVGITASMAGLGGRNFLLGFT
jgi:hypothetical protein